MLDRKKNDMVALEVRNKTLETSAPSVVSQMADFQLQGLVNKQKKQR